MARYLDPKADVTFKKIFGEHKNLVISLLNALLPLDQGKEITAVEYLPPEMVPRTPIDKDTSVDVRCEETGGRKFIVEMQMNWTASFKQRVMFNASKAYVRQLGKGDDYESLQPVYSLNLVNAVFEPDAEEYYHYYRMVHYLHSDKLLEGLHLVFVELPKFKARNFTEKKMQVLWLRFLTEIGEATKDAPPELAGDPHVKQALEILEESAYNEAEMYAYDRFWDFVSRRKTELGDFQREMKALAAKCDAISAKCDAIAVERDAITVERDAAAAERDAITAERDAVAAERDAAVEKLRLVVRGLKDAGMSLAQIAKATGLAENEIERL